MDALTEHLVPDVEKLENELYDEEHPLYLPPELVNDGPTDHSVSYHCYLIELKMNPVHNVPVHNVILVVNTKLDLDTESTIWDLEVSQGKVGVEMNYLGEMDFTVEQVLLCRRFQIAVFRAMLDRNFDKLKKALDGIQTSEDSARLDYLILPSASQYSNSSTIDWRCVESALFQSQDVSSCREDCSPVYTRNGSLCRCILQNCLVYTPHNDLMYCVSGFIDHLNSNSNMRLNRKGVKMSYKQYFKKKHGIDLRFENQLLLDARPMFPLQKFLPRGGQRKQKDWRPANSELPPEICDVFMSSISVSTFYTFSFVPLVMHRIESLLMAANLQRMYMDHCMRNVVIPTTKILEAITTLKCQEAFDLESLETLGDSFLKYAVCQQLFKTHQDDREGPLTHKKKKIISNSALCKLGYKHKIPGFIRDKLFEPKHWTIPGGPMGRHLLEEEWVSPALKMYRGGKRRLEGKTVADVVEALIGAFLSCGGEAAALLFMNWLGIEVNFSYVPYNTPLLVDPRMLVNVDHLESLLKYSFRDPCLLVEALTHGSCRKPEIPRCYQRLEFLGDSVLDYLITLHLYSKHTELSPEMLTDMRSASVNNDCYAFSAFRAELHKHIIHRNLDATIRSFEQSLQESTLEITFGWEIDIHVPKVLADVIESLAGAIFVDSGYNKDVVFKSLKPLLEPLVTPETLKLHPVYELNRLCQMLHFDKKKLSVHRQGNAATSFTLEVEANGVVYSHTCNESDKHLARRIASRAILKSLKNSIPGI